MLDLVLNFFLSYQMELMAALMVLTVIVRFMSYKASKYDEIYFYGFTREVEKNLDHDREKNVEVGNIEQYMNNMMNKVLDQLPVRSLRFKMKSRDEEREKNRFGAQQVTSMNEYVSGKRSLVHGIMREINAFKTNYPPSFTELTAKIMEKDQSWVNLFGILPIDKVSRMIDLMPGLFVVLGIFGTFVGISAALPEIAKINFENVGDSGKILTQFVLYVTFSMKTSVAGIFYSMTLTILNTLFPIAKVRSAIFKNVENCFRSLWQHIHGAADPLPNILKSVSKIEQMLAKHESDKEIDQLKAA